MEDVRQRPWAFSKCIISLCFQPRISPGSLARTTPSLPFRQTPPFHAVLRQGFPNYSFFKIKNKINLNKLLRVLFLHPTFNVKLKEFKN
jgi:hypothetical protein